MRRKVEFVESDLVEVKPTPNLNLPDIEATRCMRARDGSPYMVFYCTPSERQSVCHNCGSLNIIGNGYTAKPRIVHDINIGVYRVDLVIEVPRYRCKDCDSAFRHNFDSIPEKCQHTYRLYEQIKREAFLRPFTDVAAEYGYTEATIRNIFDEYANQLEQNRGPLVAPRVLGIDEKHIARVMRGVFVDIETGRLIEMTPGNKEADILSVLNRMEHTENIEIVTIDMANGYRAKIQMHLPYAKIIVDKFHVYQDLYRQVTRAKTLIMTEIGKQIDAEPDAERAAYLKQVRELVLHNAYLFKFSKDNLTKKPRRLAIMADVCATFPQLNHLRLIKEGFERIYDESKTREEAEKLYLEWVRLIPPVGSKKVADWEANYEVNASLYESLRSFYGATKLWYQEIFNYFDPRCSFTNAASEGVNSLIQRINSLGSGYGFSHLRARALYSSNIGGRISYSIKVNEASKPSTPFGYSYFDPKSFMNQHKKATSEIIQTVTQVDFNVFPSDSEYYEFDEQ